MIVWKLTFIKFLHQCFQYCSSNCITTISAGKKVLRNHLTSQQNKNTMVSLSFYSFTTGSRGMSHMLVILILSSTLKNVHGKFRYVLQRVKELSVSLRPDVRLNWIQIPQGSNLMHKQALIRISELNLPTCGPFKGVLHPRPVL